MKQHTRALWWTLTGASIVGLLASLIQTIERIQFAKDPITKLTCDLNSVFSCSNVFDAWQSSVFGFSNSLMCMLFFGITAGVALAAATGSALHRTLRLVFHFFSVFFLGFGAWYLWQSAYYIGALCVFCIFCYAAVIVMNWAWFRLHYRELFTDKRRAAAVERFVAQGGDTFVAIVWALCITAMFVLKFWK